MDSLWREIVWQQFGAAIDMLENAVRACPDEVWSDRSRQPEFWYVVFHTLFFLDLCLSGSVEGFAPPAPFTLDELDPGGDTSRSGVYERRDAVLSRAWPPEVWTRAVSLSPWSVRWTSGSERRCR